MNKESGSAPCVLFSPPNVCAAYLFRRRWPRGFICPFCRRLQKGILPAHSVVCSFCQKKTSITSHTIMHGTKQSLRSWMLVAWQFCLRAKGISAREIQRLLELGSYQTAWYWLMKLRKGAALAEKSLCRGDVLVQVCALQKADSDKQDPTALLVALESEPDGVHRGRLRITVLPSLGDSVICKFSEELVERGATLLVADESAFDCMEQSFRIKRISASQQTVVAELMSSLECWFGTTYRKALMGNHLQNYLDEFVFRFNTSSMPSRLLVFEHLLSGMLETVDIRNCNLVVSADKGASGNHLSGRKRL